jgi:hypothetical protein
VKFVKLTDTVFSLLSGTNKPTYVVSFKFQIVVWRNNKQTNKATIWLACCCNAANLVAHWLGWAGLGWAGCHTHIA